MLEKTRVLAIRRTIDEEKNFSGVFVTVMFGCMVLSGCKNECGYTGR